MNWSRIIGNIGRTLIGAGTLILLFVVYQLWGTALQEARAQDALLDDFNAALEEQLGEAAAEVSLDEVVLPDSLESTAVQQASVDIPTDAETAAEAAEARIRTGDLGTTDVIDLSRLPDNVIERAAAVPPPVLVEGDSAARIRIPRIGVDKTVVEGVTTDALREGPGHYPGTPLPGQAGNSAIAGHRTTYGAPFHRLDELQENDLIYVTTVQGSFVYRVAESLIVSPTDVYVLDATEDNRLTLTTCHPRYSARQRLIIVAELLGDPVDADPSQVLESGDAIAQLPEERIDLSAVPTTAPADGEVVTEAAPATTEAPAPTTTVPEPAQTVSEVAHGGIGSDSDAIVPSIFLALLTTFVGIAIWLASHRWRAWQAYLVGAPIFLIALFYFFEAFSRAVAWNV